MTSEQIWVIQPHLYSVSNANKLNPFFHWLKARGIFIMVLEPNWECLYSGVFAFFRITYFYCLIFSSADHTFRQKTFRVENIKRLILKGPEKHWAPWQHESYNLQSSNNHDTPSLFLSEMKPWYFQHPIKTEMTFIVSDVDLRLNEQQRSCLGLEDKELDCCSVIQCPLSRYI